MAMGALTISPQSFHAVTIERPIIADQRDVLSDSLGNEHAIERIGVWTGKQSRA